ncbi:MAG TPA: methyltransferase domain-containing protein [Stellaceae bacterium]|jgi:hypothetical protein|nr:methyltransferase domain-containing protein [Stellaceae bacterium]
MIRPEYLQRIVETCQASARVLDVGGWYIPFNMATHVIDAMPHETRRRHEAVDPEHEERFSAETWVQADICNGPWPYPDKHFDYAYCSHTLEDIRDPIHVCRELSRVAKAGYVEFPSRQREIFSKVHLFELKRAVGRIPAVGYTHHRWFVDVLPDRLVFLGKTNFAQSHPDFYITRRELGRKMTRDEQGSFMFWEGELKAEERLILNDADLAAELRRFKQETLRQLK